LTLGNASLVLNLNYDAQSGDLIYISKNNGTSSVAGIFANLPDGSLTNLTFSASNHVFQISYTSDFTTRSPTGGNDIVLIRTGVPNISNAGYPSNMTATSVWLGGNTLGYPMPTAFICWGESDGGTNPANWQNIVDTGARHGPFSTNITGLTMGTPYYYRCFASNTIGQTWDTGAVAFTVQDPIIATAGPSGTISPSGTVVVALGGSTNFNITASPHYHISSITTNGTLLGYIYNNSLTNISVAWSNITAGGTITALFLPNFTTNTATPESWLSAFYPATNNFENAGISDTDNDGLMAWEEYIAGTDPTNTLSTFAITAIQQKSGSNCIIWLSYTNWTVAPYVLQQSTNMAETNWQIVQESILRTPPTNIFWAPAPTNTARFYRLTCTNTP